MSCQNLISNPKTELTTPLQRLILAAFIVLDLMIVFLGLTGQLNPSNPEPFPLDWVDIPARVFLMGSPPGASDAHLDEFPRHQVFLNAFQINRYLITNNQFLECVQAGICKKPSVLIEDPEKADHPVVNITLGDARTFCEWHGARLPTEAEWEMAARGGLVGARFPWGDEINCQFANYDDCAENTTPVGSYPPNGYGLYDMAGNVWEWVSDWYNGSYYRNTPLENPSGPAEGDHRVLRGGSWGQGQDFLRVAHRGFSVPTYPHDFIGFRCARSKTP